MVDETIFAFPPCLKTKGEHVLEVAETVKQLQAQAFGMWKLLCEREAIFKLYPCPTSSNIANAYYTVLMNTITPYMMCATVVQGIVGSL